MSGGGGAGVQFTVDSPRGLSPSTGKTDSNAIFADSLVMTPTVHKLYTLRDAPMVEDEAKLIFNNYAKAEPEHALTLLETRIFLADLQQAFGYPPFLPDESLTKVLRELQLDFESPDRVSWPDFKSFFVYLVHSPLRHLHNLASEPINSANCYFKKAIWISNLPPRISSEEADAALRGIFRPDSVVKTFVSPSSDALSSVAVVFFNSAEPQNNAIQASGCIVLGKPVKIELYVNQRFPAFLAAKSNNPSTAAIALAHTVEFGQAVAQKAAELDQQLKISESLKKFDDQYKVSETTSQGWKSVSEKSKELWNHFDEKTHTSATIENLSKQAAETPTVQSGWNFLRGIVSNVTSTITVLKNETVQVLEEKKLSDPHAKIASEEEKIEAKQHDGSENAVNSDETLLPGEEDVIGSPTAVQYGSTS